MEPLYEEILTQGGTIVKPYYWLSLSLGCTNCPYHIRTGEEARVPYTEFHQTFGFPWSTYPQTKHLTFYELRSSSKNLIQKGLASNCTGSHNHPEAMLFEKNGYLDAVIFHNSNIRHIILYSNPQGLGNTVQEIGLANYPDIKTITKTQFSMMVPEVVDLLSIQHSNVKSVILCGIESHVCVQGTCLHLLERGFDVHLVVDGISSRSNVDRMFAFDRMKSAGAWLTTSEAVILGLVGDASHPHFKACQKLIINPPPDTGLSSLFSSKI